MFRALCLHGRGANAEVLEIQLARLREQLDDVVEFDFFEGAETCPGDNDVTPFFPPGSKFYKHFTPSSASSVLESKARLVEFIASHGPFDGIIGFSQGCSLAASVIATHNHILGLRFAVFLCGARPIMVERLGCSSGEDSGYSSDSSLSDDDFEITRTRPFSPSDVPSNLDEIRTLHVLGGTKDPYHEEGQRLYKLCSQKGKPAKCWSHGEGHRLPRSTMATTKIESLMRETIQSSSGTVTRME